MSPHDHKRRRVSVVLSTERHDHYDRHRDHHRHYDRRRDDHRDYRDRSRERVKVTEWRPSKQQDDERESKRRREDPVDTTGAKPSTQDKQLKHILCNSLERNVKCPHHNWCWYSHSVEEQKKYLIQKPCIHLDANGKCTMENCKFDHSLPRKVLAPSERVQKLCNFVQPDGTCKFGPSCKFLHEITQTNQLIVELSDAEDDDDEDDQPAPPVEQDVQDAVSRCLQEYNIQPVKRKRVLTVMITVDEEHETASVMTNVHQVVTANHDGFVRVLQDCLVPC